MTRTIFCIAFTLFAFLSLTFSTCVAQTTVPQATELPAEKLPGTGFWISNPEIENSRGSVPVVVKVWFEDQFLGDGQAYMRRAKEFSNARRTQLRKQVVQTLKQLNANSYAAAEAELKKLSDDGTIDALRRYWIFNGFSCSILPQNIRSLEKVPGVRKVFVVGRKARNRRGGSQPAFKTSKPPRKFDPQLFDHPWYSKALKADRVWDELGVTGKGTLNVIHDFNFVLSPQLRSNVYLNPNEIADNNIDDDKNGLIDDIHGYNFGTQSNLLTTKRNASSGRDLHGTNCAAIVCGQGTKKFPVEFGIAPEGKWAGVIAGNNFESAVEWAIEQNADTYSMSFSRPGLGEVRSHWRKVFEHGSFCGVFFVSGAGNFAKTEKVPVQMRIPEDIPNVVFAAAGVQQDLSRTEFSSKGPVEWNTEHYRDGRVQKPEVCAFNFRLPMMLPDGTIRKRAISGNSFAGPMFCGSIALMLSADPDLLPWDLKEIITSTATDVGPSGVDDETGHGLINCYDAVKEVLRRSATRDAKVGVFHRSNISPGLSHSDLKRQPKPNKTKSNDSQTSKAPPSTNTTPLAK